MDLVSHCVVSCVTVTFTQLQFSVVDINLFFTLFCLRSLVHQYCDCTTARRTGLNYVGVEIHIKCAIVVFVSLMLSYLVQRAAVNLWFRVVFGVV